MYIPVYRRQETPMRHDFVQDAIIDWKKQLINQKFRFIQNKNLRIFRNYLFIDLQPPKFIENMLNKLSALLLMNRSVSTFQIIF